MTVLSDEQSEVAYLSRAATKGDVVRALVYVTSAVSAVAQLAVASDAEQLEALKKLLNEMKDLQKLISELRGQLRDGE